MSTSFFLTDSPSSVRYVLVVQSRGAYWLLAGSACVVSCPFYAYMVNSKVELIPLTSLFINVCTYKKCVFLSGCIYSMVWYFFIWYKYTYFLNLHACMYLCFFYSALTCIGMVLLWSFNGRFVICMRFFFKSSCSSGERVFGTYFNWHVVFFCSMHMVRLALAWLSPSLALSSTGTYLFF